MDKSGVVLGYEDYVSGVSNWNAYYNWNTYYKKGVLRRFFMSLTVVLIVKIWDEDFMQGVEKKLAIGRELRGVYRVALLNYVETTDKRNPELERAFS